jgi:hypothetical protein
LVDGPYGANSQTLEIILICLPQHTVGRGPRYHSQFLGFSILTQAQLFMSSWLICGFRCVRHVGIRSKLLDFSETSSPFHSIQLLVFRFREVSSPNHEMKTRALELVHTQHWRKYISWTLCSAHSSSQHSHFNKSTPAPLKSLPTASSISLGSTYQ